MKKIILLSVFSLALCVEVTFNVDMSDQEVGSEGPTLWMGAIIQLQVLLCQMTMVTRYGHTPLI